MSSFTYHFSFFTYHFSLPTLPFRGLGGFFYSLFLVSIIIVTGPSFVRLTFMSAPNSP